MALFVQMHCADEPLRFFKGTGYCSLIGNLIFMCFPPFQWVEIDDVIEAVMRKISLEPDSSVCCYQFGILLQLGLDNATEIKDLVIIDDIQKFGADEVDFATLRQACKSQSFKVYYKWAKRLLELFLAESHLLLVEKGKAIQMLRVSI